jgi:cellulose synthase (UDP-forming)
MPDLHLWSPLLFFAGLLLMTFMLLGQHSKYSRAFSSLLCIALYVRYLYWRILFTTPLHQNLAQHIWSRCFLTMEICAVTSNMLLLFFMSRHIDRSSVADTRQNSPLSHAPVDVFIATYNEDCSILERTIVGAKAIQHSDLRVWVLDDGARPEMRRLAANLGVLYTSRVKGKHAKAGNVNNGLKHALSTGRRPEFILLLDADFVPYRNLLRRTLGLFEESNVGLVQTPQHFFNPDPVQSNLLCTTVWPDEQRFFFNVLMPCKDAWGVAFCCGTSAVIRVAALEACGGMAIETVTEDMLTSLKMQEHGYRTIYLNERLSMGLAPENLQQFVSQRARWCLGTMQQIFTRWSFAGRARIGLISRLAFLDSVMYWVSSAAFKLMLLSAPILFWFTGTAVLRANVPDLLYWMAPALAANLIFMGLVTGNHLLPIMTDVNQLITMFAVSGTVVLSLVRPFGHNFKVTMKGLSTTRVTVHWSILWRFAALALLTILGMLLRVFSFSPYHGRPGYSLNVFWSLLNTAILVLACAACIELPKRRADERFTTNEEAIVVLEDGTELPCRLQDISLGGACLVRDSGWPDIGKPACLVLDYGRLIAPFEMVRRAGRKLALKFHAAPWIRHALVLKLFTGAYHRDVESIRPAQVFYTLMKAVLS